MSKDLLLEIGSEELPASFIAPALEELESLLLAKLQAARLDCGEASTYGTPRRLAVIVRGVGDQQPDLATEVLGPPARIAFDAQGRPTDVARKWAAGQGASVEVLVKKETPRGIYVFLERKEKGQPAASILPALLLEVIKGLSSKKSMRWGWEEERFSRPVQWICALHGGAAVPFRYADVESGSFTYGHRFLSGGPIELKSPSEYLGALERAQVIADVSRRRALVREAIAREAATIGGAVRDDPGLLETVTFLVEHPTAVLGSFDRAFLDLPPEVLVSEARGHQKYFSVNDGQGRLAPAFVAVSNTPVKDKAVSRAGYERVLRARLSDARFFFTEDKKRPLASRVDDLKRVVFQQKLGTSYEKMERFRSLALFLAQSLGLSGQSATVERAATLCKADLVTGMVGEFPELQGVMGREYAAGSETAEVALALFEHYLPRTANDSLPTADAGALVGIADRLDTIAGILAIGKGPTGAADPYGLRRACLAIINIALARGYRFSLGAATDKALDLLGAKVADRSATRAQVLDFFRERLKNLWAEKSRKDVVEAILSAGFDDLVAARERLAAMGAVVGRPDFEPLAVAFKRAVNIIEKQAKDVKVGGVDPSLFQEDAERKLHRAYESARGRVEGAVGRGDFEGALREITGLKPAVDEFFDQVRVLAEDPQVKANRISLLAAIGRLFGGIADFSKIQIAGELRS
jgi:glycyl-tRNA synthetase beta chain